MNPSKITEKKTKETNIKDLGVISKFVVAFLSIHEHRHFRRMFCCLLISHIITLMLTDLDGKFQIPE